MDGANHLEQLKADLKRKQPGRFYVFHGPEAYLRGYYLNALHSLVVEDYLEAFNYHRFNGETISLQAVGDSISAIPMMGGSSMVQIDDVDFFQMGEDANEYAKFFSNIPDYCTLVLVYTVKDFKIDKRKKALEEAFSRALIVEFTPPTERELVTWVGRHFKKNGKQITVSDAQFLILQTGGDMTNLLSEIEKLSAYVQEPVVTKQDIQLIVEPVLEAVAYELSDAIAAAKYETALQKLQTLLQKQEEPIKILATISGQMRRNLTAKRLLAAGKGQQELIKLCGIQSFSARKTLEFAGKRSERFCEQAVLLCLEADRRMKTSFDEPERILELLVLELAAEAAHD